MGDSTVNIVILDKHRDIYDEVRQIIDQVCPGQIYRRVSSAFEMATYIYDDAKGDVDLLMISISSQQDDHIAAAAAIQDFFPHVQVVFYSDNNDCAQEIFVADPSFFLRYPFDSSLVATAIQKVTFSIFSKRNQQIVFHQKGQLFKLWIHSIYYIESVGRKLCIYAQDGCREVNMTFEKIKEQLPDSFMQCHRSYIVNMDKVIHIRGEELELANHFTVPIARPRIKLVKEYMNKTQR